MKEADWYHPEDAIGAWVRLAAAGQAKAASLTDAYLSKALSAITGRTVDPIGATPPAQPRGVDPTTVYGRPAEQYRYARSQGATEAEATQAAETRLRLVVDDDLLLTERDTTQQVYDAHDEIEGYRRIVHPELARDGSCGLCVVAADRIYHKADLMPIHDRCHCTTLPIVGENDPGKELNGKELAALYKQAGGNTGKALKRTRISVHEHGELGPVLRNADDHFTGPAEAEARAA